MGRNKGHYNKNCERVRQEKLQIRGKYKNPTAVCLKEKITGENQNEEIENDFINLYEKHYNACYSAFSKRALVKNSYNTYQKYKKNQMDFLSLLLYE